MDKINYETVSGTWAKALYDNWLAFNDVVRMMDDSNGKVPHENLRDYILYDMRRRHEEEEDGKEISNRKSKELNKAS